MKSGEQEACFRSIHFPVGLYEQRWRKERRRRELEATEETATKDPA